MKEIGIYVHIPFCIKKCKYCDFVSFEKKLEFQTDYTECLIKNIQAYDALLEHVFRKVDRLEKTNASINIETIKKYFDEDICIDTIYFGGGTPSCIDSKNIINILKTIKSTFNVKEDAEVTIEVNPGTINREKLLDYENAGFNRISIGLQSTNNNLLKKIGRIHTFEDFNEAYKTIIEVGFKNINIDLMLALPEQTIDDLIDSLNEVISLNPNHISLYSLILEENTPLFEEVKDGKTALPAEDIERKMYHKTKNILEKNGYYHYEISNFAKPGFESKHNENCWNQKEYLGFGLAAHSYFNNIRFSNKTNLEEYIHNIKNDKLAENIDINEIQNKESKAKEFMMLGLRKIKGVSISEFEQRFKINPLFYFRFEISKLVDEELIEVDLDYIKLTKKGLDLANLVFEEFI